MTIDEKPRDRTDIGFDADLMDHVNEVQETLHLKDTQDVARIAIAYAARRGVDLQVSTLKGTSLENTWKGSELDQSGVISNVLKLFYPDHEELESQRNLCLEYLMHEGIRLIKKAIDQGDITSLASLMPSESAEPSDSQS